MTAHPKLDPDSNEMLFFANFPTGRITGDLEVYRANSAGQLLQSHLIQGPFAALVHDFAITKDFVIIPMCPVTVSIKRAMAGAPADRVGTGQGHPCRHHDEKRRCGSHQMV